MIVVSEGVAANWLREQAAQEEITNLTVLPFPPFASVPDVLATGDVLIALLTADAASAPYRPTVARPLTNSLMSGPSI